MSMLLRKARRMHEAKLDEWRSAWACLEEAVWECLSDRTLEVIAATNGAQWAAAIERVEPVLIAAGLAPSMFEPFIDWSDAHADVLNRASSYASGEIEPNLADWPHHYTDAPEPPFALWTQCEHLAGGSEEEERVAAMLSLVLSVCEQFAALRYDQYGA